MVVETLSQYVWIRPLKQLNAETCRNAFRKILDTDKVMKEIKPKLRRVVSDQGNEFKSFFHQFLLHENIEHVFTSRGTLNKACFAELAIKHIKAILGRALNDNRSNVLNKIHSAVFSMNNAVHSPTRPAGISAIDLLLPPNKRSRIGGPMEPCEQLIERTLIHYRQYQAKKHAHAIVRGQRQRFRVNDSVRIAIESDRTFSKISDPQWSSESYKVTSIVQTYPILSYRLAVNTPDKVLLPLPGSFSETKLKLAVQL